MQQVLEECARARQTFAPDPVHDLRVALRRCRSLADGLMAMDPDPAWKQMKKAGKQLFASLGELRDVHVIQEWIHRLGEPDDLVTQALAGYLASREAQLKAEALVALDSFDQKQWTRWSRGLPGRASRLRPGSVLFKHLALERWTTARELHRRAMQGNSQTAFHRLRIGLKRFRYIVENFLPIQHSAWKHDLKRLQDLLGEVHDLDVLWLKAVEIHAFPDADSRARWRSKIDEERNRRISEYREKMAGSHSLWSVWRSELPSGKEIEMAALERLKRWAAFLDPDVKHSMHVTRLSLQLYDGLAAAKGVPAPVPNQREILRVAALMHDVGLAKTEKGHHKATYHLLSKVTPPLGWNQAELRLAGVVARYHRGALPRAGQKTLRGLTVQERRVAVCLAGILRLASALDSERDGRIRRLEVASGNGTLLIGAEGYSPRDRMAEGIASARHLLEVVYRRPVMIRALSAARPGRRRTQNRNAA